jgi:hypothetical protein
MAYELGLICDVPDDLSPEALVRELCRAIEPPPALSRWRYGDSWAACEVDLTQLCEPATLQANVADGLVATIALQGVEEGALADPLGFRVVFSITLVGDVDWTPIRTLIQAARENWRGVLFDDVSGFDAVVE